MEYVDENGRNIGIEITACWCRDIKLPEMDDYTSSSCYAYKTLIKKRGEKGLWITVFFFDSVFKVTDSTASSMIDSAFSLI